MFGRALIIDAGSTTVVEPGWQATVDRIGNLILTRASRRARQRAAIGTAVDPVRLEIFNNLFMAIAEEMGVVLQTHGAPRSTSRSGSISPARCSTATAR